MKDQIRAEFEQEFPLPKGVTFDGDHYVADPNVLGSFQNAAIWSHMFRGWKRRQETLHPQDKFLIEQRQALARGVDLERINAAMICAGIHPC